MGATSNEFVHYCAWVDDCGDVWDDCPGHHVLVEWDRTSDFTHVWIDGEERWFSESGLASKVGFLMQNPYPDERPDWLGDIAHGREHPRDHVAYAKARRDEMRAHYSEHLRYPKHLFIPRPTRGEDA